MELASVSRTIVVVVVVVDEPKQRDVVRKHDNEISGATGVCKECVEKWAQYTALRDPGSDYWQRFVRKSKTQLHKVVLSPRWCSLDRSLFGQIVLKAGIKSNVYGSCAFSSCSNLQEAGKYTLVSSKCVVPFYLPFFSGSRNGKFPKGAHKVQEFLEVVKQITATGVQIREIISNKLLDDGVRCNERRFSLCELYHHW